MRKLTIPEMRTIAAALQSWSVSRDEAPIEIQSAATYDAEEGDLDPLTEGEIDLLAESFSSAVEVQVAYE